MPCPAGRAGTSRHVVALIWAARGLSAAPRWLLIAARRDGSWSSLRRARHPCADRLPGSSQLDESGDLPAVIADYRPSFTVYFSSTIGADYQVGMWLPYFKRIGSRFIIVTRTVAMMEIAGSPGAGVRCRSSTGRRLRSLEDVSARG